MPIQFLVKNQLITNIYNVFDKGPFLETSAHCSFHLVKGYAGFIQEAVVSLVSLVLKNFTNLSMYRLNRLWDLPIIRNTSHIFSSRMA